MKNKFSTFVRITALWIGCFGSAASVLAEKPQSDLFFGEPNTTDSAAMTAEEINTLFQKAGVKGGTKVDDYTYLRRAFLDTVGKAPTPGQIDAFVQNGSKNKRSQMAAKLLENPEFGNNWGRYWRDVILARRSDDRALGIVANGLTTAMGNRLNEDVSWRQIARSFITASGDIRKNGETGLFLAQKGEAAEITSEITRIFMGVQIQCAQCHDHPSEDWTREQFHQMAAFFPRLGVRRVPNAVMRSFEVYSADGQRADGQRADGQKRKKKRKTKLEHFMPDPKNPKARGTIMQPVFFQTGQSLKLGTPDADRRETLAEWMTDPDANPWFTRAYVNRIWSELVGKGFYEPVDDLGEEKEGIHTDVLTYLSDRFVEEGFDTKWLFRTIMATDIYQQQAGSQASGETDSIATRAPQPLRGDQLFSSLCSTLQIDNFLNKGKGKGGKGKGKGKGGKGKGKGKGGKGKGGKGKGGKGKGDDKGKGPAKQNRGAVLFNLAFFYDPSLPRDEINSTIPQALMMMNSPQLHRFISSDRSGGMLREMLADDADNQDLVKQLHLRCLSREPCQEELEICLAHIEQTGDRAEACEDILWALINSAEFRHRK